MKQLHLSERTYEVLKIILKARDVDGEGLFRIDLVGDYSSHTPLEALGLSVRVYCALRRCEIDSIEKLLTIPDSLALSIVGLGAKSLSVINTQLVAHGYPELGHSYEQFDPSDFLEKKRRNLLVDYSYSESLQIDDHKLILWGLIRRVSGSDYSITPMGRKICDRCSILGLY